MPVPQSHPSSEPRPAAPQPSIGRGTPRTIWGMLSAELLTLLLVSGSALVVIIAFGLAMQPLAAGRVGVGDAVRFAALLTVPMLQYAMPFAGGFAATLTYHRFASEREATACASSGIPHRTLLAPALALGGLLGVGMFAMGVEVIPRFLRTAEALVARDVGNMIITPLQLGRSVRVDDLDIRAGEVVSLGPDTARGVTQHLAMFDVFATRVDPEGQSNMFVSAERVDLWVYEQDEGSAMAEGGSATTITDEGFIAGPTAVAVLQLAFTNASGQMPDGAVVGETLILNPIRVPTTLSDNVKFLTWRAMDRALAEPRRMSRIDRDSRRLAALLSRQAARDILSDELATLGTITLRRYEQETLTIGAFDAAGRPIPDGIELRPIAEQPGSFTLHPKGPAPLTVLWRDGDDEHRVQRPAAATLSFDALDQRTGEPLGYIEARLDMQAVSTITGGLAEASTPGALGGERATLRIAALRLASDPTPAIAQQPAEILLNRADAAIELAGLNTDARMAALPASAPAVEIAAAAEQLRKRMERFRNEITSKRNENAAFGVTACLMILLGAILALRMAGSLQLAVYLCSFLPALAAVILISVGERMAFRQGALIGLPMLWSGVVGLAVYALIELRRVGRH